MNRAMNFLNRQRGVTLLEVLVGFVIFTTTLVAVLEYVSGQVYHFHLSSSNLQKTQAIYSQSVLLQQISDDEVAQSYSSTNLDLMVSSSMMDSTTQRGGEVILNRHSFSVGDSNSALTWAVIRVD